MKIFRTKKGDYSDNLRDSYYRIGKRTLIIFSPIFLIIFIATCLILYNQEQMELKVYKSSEIRKVESKLNSIESDIEHIIYDLLAFSLNSTIVDLWDDQYHSESNLYKTAMIKNLTNEMRNMVTFNRTYDQVRLIDKNGMEIIRINFNNGSPSIVPKDKLQNKKNRYYFQDAIKLSELDIFVSHLDLNIENGVIEQPIKPMIRFATPVFDNAKVKRGIVMLNYLAENILLKLKNDSSAINESQLMLVNADGYFLKANNPEIEWGFMYDDKKDITFSSLYADAWENIQAKESSQFQTKEGIYTFQTIYPLIEGNKLSKVLNNNRVSSEIELHFKQNYWKVISFIPSEKLFASQNNRRHFMALLLALFALALFITIWVLAKVQYSRSKLMRSLKNSNDSKDKFFSIIAHDLKGPFNSLLGFSEILIEDAENEDKDSIKEISMIFNATLKNTYNLLINLLDWSRAQTNRIEYKPETFVLKSMVNEIIELLKLQIEKKKITINIPFSDDLKVFADRNMLNAVIRNLLSNALKYANIGGKITILASVQDGSLHFAVSDTGIGMSKEISSGLFQLSKNQSRPGTDNEKGTGLGLILCKDFIERHNGEIGIDSEVGKGSTFWFDIPN